MRLELSRNIQATSGYIPRLGFRIFDVGGAIASLAISGVPLDSAFNADSCQGTSFIRNRVFVESDAVGC